MGILESITSMAGNLGQLSDLVNNPQLAQMLKNPQIGEMLKNVDASDFQKVVDYIKENGVPTDANAVSKIIEIVTKD